MSLLMVATGCAGVSSNVNPETSSVKSNGCEFFNSDSNAELSLAPVTIDDKFLDDSKNKEIIFNLAKSFPRRISRSPADINKQLSPDDMSIEDYQHIIEKLRIRSLNFLKNSSSGELGVSLQMANSVFYGKDFEDVTKGKPWPAFVVWFDDTGSECGVAAASNYQTFRDRQNAAISQVIISFPVIADSMFNRNIVVILNSGLFQHQSVGPTVIPVKFFTPTPSSLKEAI